MCGIAGLFAYGTGAPPVDEGVLLAMREQMARRGPDGAGLWLGTDRRVGLAHRRLSVIDLSDGGHQPMRDCAAGNVIVFNGEIYNYRTLRAELEAAGHHFASTSDTEVLLKLYRVHGTGFLPKLRGMYAFALYDEAERRIFLARDPFGIKPLYLSDDGHTLRFASQVKALLAGGIRRLPDPAGHVGFFLWGHVPEPFTLFKNIKALPAGSHLVVEADGTRRTAVHFDMAKGIANLEPFPGVRSASDAQAILTDALRDSVRHHLVADVPVGVFLSSGRDSNTLAALAEELAPGIVRTITLGFEDYRGTALDEVPLAETLAAQLGTTHQTRWIGRDSFYECIDDLIATMDQPSIDGVNTYLVARAAREAGLKVALSGLGGDELFGGYSAFGTIPRLVRLASLAARIPGAGGAFRRTTAPLLGAVTSPKYAGLLEYGGTFAGAYLLRQALFMPWELEPILGPRMAEEGWDELRTMAALDSSIAGIHQSRLKVSALMTGWYMRNQLLRDSDWAGMAHSLEIRTPLVDLPLWETVTRLALGGHAVGKQDMAASPVTPLPPAILNRPKTGFSAPVHEWLRAGPLRHGTGRMRGLRGWATWLHRQAGFDVAMAA
ncbi:MAG: asparagine synthase (glutamine-hydrolyzing) [Albidovulum sp.]